MDEIIKIGKDVIYDFSTRWKLFLFSMVAIFVMVMLSHLHLPKPQPLQTVQYAVNTLQNKPDPFGPIREKLEQKKNNFTLHTSTDLIPSAYAASGVDQAASYAVMNADTGDVLAQKDINQPVYIASLTKIMSAMVSLDLSSPDTIYTVTDPATHVVPTVIGVTAGEKFTLKELLTAALMYSANDSVEVIRQGIDQQYGPGTFVKAMNDKAQFIGLKNTHFTNPQGFDDPYNFSSSGDLLIMTHYALENYPLINQIIQQQTAILPANQYHKEYKLVNWNSLVGVYPGAYGVKIGQTDDAHKTMIVGAKRGNTNVIAVVLSAPGYFERDQWTASLLDLGFEKLANLSPVSVTKSALQAKYNSWYQ